MKIERRGFLQAGTMAGVMMGTRGARAATPVNLIVDLTQAGATIDANFLGLSYETDQTRSDDKGHRYFRAANAPLVTLFRTIGVRSLRIGGNSVDSPVNAPPALEDVYNLFDFARASGVRVIYSLRLKNGDPALAAETARHIYDRYGDVIDTLSIGNEPEEFLDLAHYHQQWTAIREAVSIAVPQARFSGPDTNPWLDWEADTGARLGGADYFAQLNVHSYVGGCSYQNPSVKHVEDLIPIDIERARAAMLSPAWYDLYADVRKTVAAAGGKRPFRLSETNNFWYGGLHRVSDSFAAALWSADYLHWWARSGAVGVNFHTGDRVGGGTTSLVSRYAAFVTHDAGYEVRPLSYGMMLFRLGGEGRVAPVTLRGVTGGMLAAYAMVRDDELRVTLINKTYGAHATPFAVALALPKGHTFGAVRQIVLTAPDGDAAAQSGLQLGGQPIAGDGSWNGDWTSLHDGGDTIQIESAPASAMVVAIKVKT